MAIEVSKIYPTHLYAYSAYSAYSGGIEKGREKIISEKKEFKIGFKTISRTISKKTLLIVKGQNYKHYKQLNPAYSFAYSFSKVVELFILAINSYKRRLNFDYKHYKQKPILKGVVG